MRWSASDVMIGFDEAYASVAVLDASHAKCMRPAELRAWADSEAQIVSRAVAVFQSMRRMVGPRRDYVRRRSTTIRLQVMSPNSRSSGICSEAQEERFTPGLTVRAGP